MEGRVSNFGVLLSNPDTTARYELNWRPSPAGKPEPLVLEPTAKSKQIRNINDWLHAFHIFVSIHTQRYLHETPALRKYCQIVQDLAGRARNWSFYDENFRFLLQTQGSQVPSATFHWELCFARGIIPVEQVMCLHRKVLHNQFRLPRGFCNKFHRGAYCSGCEIKHACCTCNGAHRCVNCNFRSAAKKIFP